MTREGVKSRERSPWKGSGKKLQFSSSKKGNENVKKPVSCSHRIVIICVVSRNEQERTIERERERENRRQRERERERGRKGGRTL